MGSALRHLVTAAREHLLATILAVFLVIVGVDPFDLILDAFYAPPFWLQHWLFRTSLVAIGLFIIGFLVIREVRRQHASAARSVVKIDPPLEKSAGRWFGPRYVLDQPMHVFTVEVGPQDNGRIFSFEVPDQIPGKTLVKWRVDVEGRHKRTKAQIVTHQSQPPFNWDAIQTPTTSGAVRLGDDRRMHVIAHSLDRTDPTVVRVYVLGWGDDDDPSTVLVADNGGVVDKHSAGEFISLSEAALTAYRATRKSKLAGQAEQAFSDKRGANPVNHYATYIALVRYVPLYGFHTDSQQFERVPARVAARSEITQDSQNLLEIGGKYHSYTQLSLRRDDFAKLLADMREKWPNEPD